MPRPDTLLVARKCDRRGAGRGDQRAEDNGKEGAAFDENALLHGARTP